MKTINRIFTTTILLLFLQIVAIVRFSAAASYYYSIHGASYQNLDKASEYITSIKAKGLDAFYEKKEITGKGILYRIYVGRYDSRKSAVKAAGNLRKTGLITENRIQKFIASNAAAQAPEDEQNKSTIPTMQPDISPSLSRGQSEEKITTEQMHPLLKGALSAFQAGKYDQALSLSNSFIGKVHTDAGTLEKALRLRADCYYFLGVEGRQRSLLTAVDQYKDILLRYPDPAKGNDGVIYRQALSYERLNFYYEATGAWERLILSYPDSTLLPEAMFRIGDVLHKMGKYNRAVERLTAYLNKYRDGNYAKVSHFILGDCYYLMKKSDSAGRWYDEARRKWFQLHDVPRTILMNMGDCYFDSGRFNDAMQIYSLYANLYPTDESGKTAFYKMAHTAEEAGQASLALMLYSRFVEKYPTGRESEDCSLGMANIGVAKPAIRLPFLLINFEDYLKPMETYDRVLAKRADGEQAAVVMLLKGNALGKYGRIREAFAVYLSMINRFPQGKYSEKGRTDLKYHATSLVDNYYEKGDYLAVSDVYFQVYSKVNLKDDFDLAFKIGKSLAALGLYNEAGALYSALKEAHKDRERQILTILALAKVDAAMNKDSGSEEGLRSLLEQKEVKDIKVLSDIKRTLADIYYNKGSFEKAVPLYADVLVAASGSIGLTTMVYRNYGRSLLAMNMTQTAVAVYQRALKDLKQNPGRDHSEAIADIYIGLGDAYCGEKNYREGIAMYRQAIPFASQGDTKKWLMYRIGQGYAGLADYAAAEKSFAQVKEPAEGDFWPKVADYFIENSRRSGENPEYKDE